MDKVLVVKAIEPNYNTVSGGPPIMMVGGGRRRRGGDEPVGRTKRERLGGALGGTVGVLGALGGQHRSLGSLAQAMISGGAQGKALGGALGRKFVGRTGQRRADIREGRRQQSAQSDAEMAEDQRRRGVGVLSRFNPAAKFRRDNQEIRDREDQLLDRTNLDHRTMAQAQQQVGVYGAGRIADAREQAQRAANAEETARAKAFGTERGEEDRDRADRMAQMEDAYGNMFGPEEQNEFNRMANQSARPIRYDVAEFEEDPAGHSGTVQPTNAAGLLVPPQLMLPPPIQPTAHSASAENGRDNELGNKFETNATTSALRGGKVAVTDGNEDEEEKPVGRNELGRIQQREAGERQMPGMRPSGKDVQVRPTEQTSLLDSEQGGN